MIEDTVTEARLRNPFAPQLAGCTASCCASSWRGQMVGVVLVEAKAATIGLISGALGEIPLAELKWARKWSPEQKLGAKVQTFGCSPCR